MGSCKKRKEEGGGVNLSNKVRIRAQEYMIKVIKSPGL